MINLYAGFDPREAVGYHVFCQSVIEHSSIPVAIAPLHKPMMGESVESGSNAFTFSRFLIPKLQHYTGDAIFMDGADMLLRADLAELEALRDRSKAVQVVKHEYKTRHSRKYVGTAMECDNRDYERKQWASVMLINCAHYAWRRLKSDTKPLDMLQLRFIEDQYIGELPIEWNWLADEMGENEDAKVLHWTAGVPAFDHYRTAPHADEWFAAFERTVHADQ